MPHLASTLLLRLCVGQRRHTTDLKAQSGHRPQSLGNHSCETQICRITYHKQPHCNGHIFSCKQIDLRKQCHLLPPTRHAITGILNATTCSQHPRNSQCHVKIKYEAMLPGPHRITNITIGKCRSFLRLEKQQLLPDQRQLQQNYNSVMQFHMFGMSLLQHPF